MSLRRRIYLFVFLIFLVVYISTGFILKIILLDPITPELKANNHFTVELFAYTILATGFVLGLTVIFIFERAILEKIIKINNKLISFHKNETKGRNTVTFKDEIENLSDNVNKTLEQLESSRTWIKERKTLYDSIIESHFELRCQFDNSFIISFLNDAFAIFFGYNSKELIGKNILSIIQPAGDNDTKNYFSSLLSASGPVKYECNLLNAKSEMRWIEWNIDFVRNNEFRICEFYLDGRDITERKKTSDALVESRARNTALLKAIPDFVFRFRRDRTLLDFHIPELQKMYSSSEKFINEIVKETFSYEKEDFNNLIDRALENGEVQTFEFRIVDGDEEYFEEVRIVATAENEEYIAIVRDITERKKAESDINRYIEELQYNEEIMEKNSQELQDLYGKLSESEAKLIELNQSKDKFFSIISHDLRNPFMALAGFTGILAEDCDKLSAPEIKKLVLSINNSALGILKLLENLLDWSNLQSGKLDFHPQKLDLQKIIDEVLQNINSVFIKKNVTTKVVLEENEIYADPFMLEVILRNLITNAIKYSRLNGWIKIASCSINNSIEISIEDNGMGISNEDLGKLFRIDEHISTTGTAKEQGTGLGLILCKEFVKKHGGDISVKSDENKGSKITFWLPSVQMG